MDKLYKYLFILFFLFDHQIFAQFQPGARQIALAHSDVALSNDVFALFGNPAGLSQHNTNQIGIFYSPSPFGLKELANGNLAYNQPTSFGNFGVGFMTYGFELYKENKFQIGYSQIFYDKLLLGVTAFYQTINIKNYGDNGFINFSLGGIFLISEDLSVGFTLYNPARFTSYSSLTSFSSGITFKPLKTTNINLAIHKELTLPISISFGAEYYLVEFLALRLGIKNEPNIYSGGIGINYSFLNLDYAVSSHQDLGLTHQIGLIINFAND